jgi:hypothetical protein
VDGFGRPTSIEIESRTHIPSQKRLHVCAKDGIRKFVSEVRLEFSTRNARAARIQVVLEAMHYFAGVHRRVVGQRRRKIEQVTALLPLIERAQLRA